MGALEFKGSDFTRIVEMTPELRQRIEATVAHLIALLDESDGDPDFEPSLGGGQPCMAFFGPAAYDLELDDYDNEDGGDAEAEGWCERDGQGDSVTAGMDNFSE